MERTKLQEMYWKVQSLHDKLFTLENYIQKLRRQGKRSRKVQDKYFELIDELRSMNAEMMELECRVCS